MANGGPEFFQTLMGRKFYEHDVPELVRQLKRIADALEAAQTGSTATVVPKKASED